MELNVTMTYDLCIV
jgi:hypothetical protein